MNQCLFLVWSISCVLSCSMIGLFLPIGNTFYQNRIMLKTLRHIGFTISLTAVITTLMVKPLITEAWKTLILFNYDYMFIGAATIIIFCGIHVTAAVYNITKFPFLITNYN